MATLPQRIHGAVRSFESKRLRLLLTVVRIALLLFILNHWQQLPGRVLLAWKSMRLTASLALLAGNANAIYSGSFLFDFINLKDAD